MKRLRTEIRSIIREAIASDEKNAIHNLHLHIENDRTMYAEWLRIVKRLQRDMKADTYHNQQAYKIFLKLVDKAVDSYCKKHDTHEDAFSKNIKNQVASDLVTEFEDEYGLGNYY